MGEAVRYYGPLPDGFFSALLVKKPPFMQALALHEMKTFGGYVYLDHHYPPVLWNIVGLYPVSTDGCKTDVDFPQYA